MDDNRTIDDILVDYIASVLVPYGIYVIVKTLKEIKDSKNETNPLK